MAVGWAVSIPEGRAEVKAADGIADVWAEPSVVAAAGPEDETAAICVDDAAAVVAAAGSEDEIAAICVDDAAAGPLLVEGEESDVTAAG